MTVIDSLRIPQFANKQWDYSGKDSLEHCFDKKTFLEWPHKISYCYNSRGFRDLEWPENLQNSVWCVGDSFTVGIGSCFSHTWPQVVEKHSGQRVINISMDGASNTWIARKVCDIYDLAHPQNIVIMWSYLHRREIANAHLLDLDRRLHYEIRATVAQDYENFTDCRKLVHNHCKNSNIIELIVPNFGSHLDDLGWQKIRDPSWPLYIPKTLSEFLLLPAEILKELRTIHDIDVDHLLDHYTIRQQQPELISGVARVENLDRNRDGHHFDIVTATWVAEHVTKYLVYNN